MASQHKNRVLIIFYGAPIRIVKFAKYLPEFGWEPILLTDDGGEAKSQFLSELSLKTKVVKVPDLSFQRAVMLRFKDKWITAPKMGTTHISKEARGHRIIDFIRLLRPFYTLPIIRTLLFNPWKWRKHAFNRGLELIRDDNINVIFSTYGPPSCHLVASRLHRQTGIPWVAEFRDLWSLNPYLKKVQPFHLCEKIVEKRVLKGSHLLVTVSEPAVEQLKRLHSKQAVAIRNGFDEEDYLGNVPTTSKFTITYTGSIYPRKQDPGRFFQAVTELKKEGRVSSRNFEVRFLGGSTLASLVPIIKSHRLQELVSIYGFVPFKESIKRQRESSVLLFLGWNDAREKGVYSAKIFEYLGARRPILAVGLKGDVVDELLKETGVGVVVNEVNDVKAILSQWLEEFENSGRITSHFAPQNNAIYQYTRRRETGQLAQVLEGALKR